MKSILGLIIIVIVMSTIICFMENPFAHAIEMDIKCTVYEHSEDLNGNDVDVRVLVMGLQPNDTYTAKVIPDHNPDTSVTTETDYEGIFWVIAKIPNGEKSTFFNVNVYQGKERDGLPVASGDDDTPCYTIVYRNPSLDD